jgi:hypothetical protein
LGIRNFEEIRIVEEEEGSLIEEEEVGSGIRNFAGEEIRVVVEGEEGGYVVVVVVAVVGVETEVEA